jgi:hypothetical protein
MTRARFLAVLALCAAMAAAGNPDIHPDVLTVLAHDLKFSSEDFARLERNNVVSHGLDTSAAGEVALAGAVQVHATKAEFFARVRDIARFKQSPDVMQIGRFGVPPAPADLSMLTVDRDDFDVRSCRVGDCGVRLPAAVIHRFQEIDPKAADAQERGAALFKQVLLDEVTAYVTGHPRRLLEYDDGPRPIRPVDEFEGILRSFPAIAALVPGLPNHLKDFPSSSLAGAEDFLYWSKEKFGIAPFITVTHVTLICTSEQTCVMTTKDVYSSRYFDASLALAIASDAVDTPKAFYLVYANRSRASALKGGLSRLRRMVAERRARGGLEASLKTIKAQLEKTP